MRVLLVEDDDLFGDAIVKGLSPDGYAVDWVKNGRQALHALHSETFDLVILDLNLPGCSGLEVLREIRQDQNMVPVLILTARDSVQDRVFGLDCGADDYVIKPVALDEIVARMRALTRRAGGHAAPVLRARNIEIDPATRSVMHRGERIEVSGREYEILFQLVNNVGHVLSRDRLKESLYGWSGEDIESNTVEVHISHLRRKLGPGLIRTLRGIGYVIDQDKQ